MVSREKFVEVVRIIAFVMHAVMAVVVVSILFACKTQVYSNTGYHIIAVDWQVCACVARAQFASNPRFSVFRTGKTGLASKPATTPSNATEWLYHGLKTSSS